MINGRSMPDDMDPNYAPQYPHQPYNGNPHMHPGEHVLLRIVGQGRWQHPFHEHGNHVRILGARRQPDPQSQADPTKLAGPLLFTTTTTPGPGDGRDLLLDRQGPELGCLRTSHRRRRPRPARVFPAPRMRTATTPARPTAINYYEWCQDHNKPLQAHPFGDVASGGPVTLPDPNILTNGAWFGGSPYLGPDATVRATGPTGTTPPSGHGRESAFERGRLRLHVALA